MHRVVSVGLLLISVLALASPVTAATSARDNGLDLLSHPPDEPGTGVEQSGNTLIVSAGAPGTLTITESPGGGGSGPTVYCGWFDLVIGGPWQIISIAHAVDPAVGETYLLICWTTFPTDPIAGYPIVAAYPGAGPIPGPAVSTAEAALHAINNIVFESPAAQLSPEARQIVGVPSWLAVTSRLDYAPVSAEAGPVWATVRPEFRDATWVLGNGDQKVCVGDATTAWNPAGPTNQGSTCTYTFQDGSGSNPYDGSVTLNWVVYQLTDKSAVTWQVWGTIGLTSPVTFDVGQLQAAVR